ncbi:MAG: D-alanyl-D-alanine carboxypeptidase [Spirochaetaceae bacterium]|jgi:D-alanyl-D-alanine carboxypeptidase (penicillin-binding protein 5/6)|nr:D-alanyl-D-alanine carboxypeptidase [Spirochaetaceae bacterium]
MAKPLYLSKIFKSFLAPCFLLGAIIELHALNPLSDIPELKARSAVLMDASTGFILFEKNPDDLIPPASLTKLMTIHVAGKEAAEKGISLDDPVKLPKQSWAVNQPPRSSLMFLAQGQIVSLDELFLGMAIPSGNDAAVAVALNFSPTTDAFAKLMNREAAALGMKDTIFVEPSGISEENITTARDFAIFCREYIRLHPENLEKYHSVPQFAYPKASNLRPSMQDKVGTIVQNNHINLIYSFDGVDGLKTGYIDESGYNIALTAERNGTRFIAVILGVPAELGSRWGIRARDADGAALLTWGFNYFKTIRPEVPSIPPARVWKGKINKLPLAIPENARALTILASRGDKVRCEVDVDDLTAPLPAGYHAGSITFYDDEGALAVVELRTPEELESGNLFKRFLDSILLFFSKAFSPHIAG